VRGKEVAAWTADDYASASPSRRRGGHTLTGIDIDQDALNIRKRGNDLDVAILGDLRTVECCEESFDVIVCNFVLEHIDGAERVLDNFTKWLKPGGVMLITVPDRDSVYGIFTRITPFKAHVLYKRYLIGIKDAGKPGHGPFPTFHDAVIGRKGIRSFSASRDLSIKEEYWFSTKAPAFVMWFIKIFSALTLGQVSPHRNLMFVVQKPDKARTRSSQYTGLSD
jgi:SAM-dependent methyltransferase